MTSLQVICGLLPPPPQSKILALSLCALCSWSLTSSIPVLGLERVCPQEVGPWQGRIYGGAIGPWPPLWVARIAKLHRKVSKIEAWPSPSLQVGHQALGSKSPDFERKMGRNLSMTISNSDLCSSQIL